jgi:hypothetical protein
VSRKEYSLSSSCTRLHATASVGLRMLAYYLHQLVMMLHHFLMATRSNPGCFLALLEFCHFCIFSCSERRPTLRFLCGPEAHAGRIASVLTSQRQSPPTKRNGYGLLLQPGSVLTLAFTSPRILFYCILLDTLWFLDFMV